MKLKDLKNEIKVLDITALIAKSRALKIEISDLVMDKNMSKLRDLKSISKKRKELARVLTVLSQKKMISKLESTHSSSGSSGKSPESSEKTEDKQSLRSGDLKTEKKGAK